MNLSIDIYIFYILQTIQLFLSEIETAKIFNVTENQLESEPVLNVFKILDLQNPDKSIIKNIELMPYHIKPNRQNHLEINRRTGDIIIKSIFDREEICPYLETDDCKIDFILLYLTITKEFSLFIKDVNDNSPNFKEKSKQISIYEGENSAQMKYHLPKAVDLDSIENGIDRYAIKFTENSKSDENFHEYFKLINHKDKDNVITPVLQIIKLLDREKVDRISFTLIAYDKKQKFGECKISILVLDINDNSPIWSNTHYSVEVKECSMQREVLKLEAYDNDDPNTENGRISYEISEKSKSNDKIMNIFHISSNMLIIDMVRIRDVESYDFEIEIIAKDGGGKSSSKTVYVKVLDCNNNKPNIEIKQRNPRIFEQETKSMKLTNIIVTDPDRGLNAEFDCVIDDSLHFQLKSTIRKKISQHSGRWVLYSLNTTEGVEFNREKQASLSVIITCTDKGIPSQSNTQVLTVHILDINDNKPEFTRQMYTFSVEENIPIGSVVANVLAVDSDINENGRVSYEIVHDSRDMFSINNKGQIHTNNDLDREKVDMYEFQVIAKDHGKEVLSSSCTVKIFILDVNDCKPEVEKQFIFEILESNGFSTIHRNLGKINASDADFGLNGTINFKISQNQLQNNRKNLLQITSDGQLTIYGNVDREISKTIHSEIIVSDNGSPPLSSITTVIINVLDVNDNKPKFSFPSIHNNNHINLSLQSSINTIIGVIEATDPDNGNNGSITYKLLGGESIRSTFELQQTGQLLLIKPLLEKRLNPDRLLIQASDGGNPSLTEMATLFLRYYSNKKPVSSDRISDKSSNGAITPEIENKEPNSLTLLYGLAAILFIVFSGVLIILLYVFLKNRRPASADYSLEKTNSRIRKNYITKESSVSNERKCNDELLDPSLCEMTDVQFTPNENYTHLMWMKEGQYNVLYPNSLPKQQIDYMKENNFTMTNVFNNYKSPLSEPNQMQVMVNNLQTPNTKSKLLFHQSNSQLQYRDSKESLDNMAYNTSVDGKTEKFTNHNQDKTNTTLISTTSSNNYTQSYITSTFV